MKAKLKYTKEDWATLFRLILNPNLLGETLRDIVFIKHNEDDLGGYSSFDLIKDFKKEQCPLILDFIRDKMGLDSSDPLDVYGSESGLLVAWSWESDGLLCFCYKDQTVLNSDCKKSHGWV